MQGLHEAKRRFLPNPNPMAIYANGFQIVLSPLDVRLVVIESAPISPVEIIDKQIASIIMTPETLKILASHIGLYVKAFEENYGKIRDMPTPSIPKLQIVQPSS